MKQRKKIHEIDSSNDIKYRGPLNYQHLRIGAWIFLALSQLSVIMSLSVYLFPDGRYQSATASAFFSGLGTLALPLLLISNFANILNSKDDYKKLLIKFGAPSAGIILLFFIFYERYLIGILSVNISRAEAEEVAANAFASTGFFSFNLFIDLFLCTLVMFFLNYTPKKHFQGNKLALFRSLAILPMIYEIISIIFKTLASTGKIILSPLVFPFLTTKPPVEFIVFIALALFIKRREREFIKSGKAADDYRDFLATNSNSWHFSVHSAIILAIATIVDLIILVITIFSFSASHSGAEALNGQTQNAIDFASKLGFGDCIPLIFISPVMLLFSYNRTPKRPKLDLLIPIIGVVIIIFEYIEAGYFAFTHLI